MNVLTRIEETFGIFLPSLAGQMGIWAAPESMRGRKETKSAAAMPAAFLPVAVGTVAVPALVRRLAAPRAEAVVAREVAFGLRLGAPQTPPAKDLAPSAKAGAAPSWSRGGRR